MKTIVITGAGGSVGSYLRKTMAGKYQLRLSDIKPLTDIVDGETFVEADVTDAQAMIALTAGADGIIHMGGIASEADWAGIANVNLQGTINIYEAARINQVPRMIVPSSNHAVGFYPRSKKIPVEVMLRPDSRYGVSKAFAELMGSLYADKYGIKTLALRIGNVADEPVDTRRLSIWISPRDLMQQVEIGLEHPDLHFDVMYGVSGNTRAWYDDEVARRLGYKPLDNSEDYADAVLAKSPPLDPNALSDQLQGGDFCVIEDGGGKPLVNNGSGDDPERS